MKFNKIILGLAAVIGFAIDPCAQAQVNGVFREFYQAVIATPGPLAAAAPILATNGPVDILGYYGTGEIDIVSSTNGGGALTVTVETSPDSTNWTGLANFGLVNSTTAVSYTNLYYGSTNLVVTDNYLYPFSITTPTAATAGYAIPYQNYLPVGLTNAAGAITITKAGFYRVGLNLTDSPRYLHLIWSATGAATNGQTVVGAWLNGQHR